MSNKTLNVSVVLPVYNPKPGWVTTFLLNIKELESKAPAGFSFEYIVVNDGSSNHIPNGVVDCLKKQVTLKYLFYNENMGKGYAMRMGVAAATTPFTILTDFDFPYAPENIITMITYLQSGYEVVIGKRNKEYFRGLPVKRRLISRSYMMLSRLSFHLPLYDIQSGIKGFGWRGKEIFLETKVNRFLIDTEFVLRSTRKGLLVKVLDVSIKKNVQFSNFGRRVIADELKNLGYLYQLNRTFKKANLPAKSLPLVTAVPAQDVVQHYAG